MKKILLSILSIATLSLGNAQNVNIPDANFKTYLLGNSAINTNNDTEISTSEASSYTGAIDCSNLGITDLTGIEAFTNNIVLNCSENSLTNLDLSANTGLSGLFRANNNNLTSLTLPNSTTLLKVYANNNTSLPSVDVSGIPNLEILMLVYTNITTLDVSNNSMLTTLNIGDTPLTSIDLSALTNLTSLGIQNTELLTLDISPCTSLNNVYAADNANLTELNMANGNNMNFSLNAFDVTNSPNLTCVTVDDVAFSNAVWTTAVDPGVGFSTDCSTTPPAILATGVTVNGLGGALTVEVGGTLQMEAVIAPANATSQVIQWQVMNGTGSATIDQTSGVLTGGSVGTVTVGAVTVDGSMVYGTLDVEVIETVGITDLNQNQMKLYPNPAIDMVRIESNSLIKSIRIFSLTGSVVQSENSPSFCIKELEPGTYIMNVITQDGMAQMKLVKQ